VIECPSCHTLNPDSERACLACAAALPRATPSGASSSGSARCPAGHPIDPSWRSCPYCERTASSVGSAGERSTRLDGVETGAAPRRTRLEESHSASDRRTRLEGEPPPNPVTQPLRPGPVPTRLEEAGAPVGRRTVLEGSAPPPPPSRPEAAGAAPVHPAPGGAASAGRLVAVLAAPDLGKSGAVFAVRAGRNTLGADRSSDIVLADDTEVSREHAVILHRNGTFHLADRLSTNGTWLNGREVPANGTVALQDRDRIRCGGTELVFLRIEPAEAEAAAGAA
jgi:hypothetical protein